MPLKRSMMIEVSRDFETVEERVFCPGFKDMVKDFVAGTVSLTVCMKLWFMQRFDAC